ncbi:hypothetical protein CAPTEDRAFT_195672 [Capitella teleta]|uniref:Uncharacterized protein n=1 Tax=Capitella teleta TaxID=283909 RepID=X1ZVD1_CAPTE|nr:hypothetical protein CAPTEDRAFT_195672 [Capitella teleta]|eukprot:ELT88386.1 hypothetical protein CAPTEDRAFT_195672 [Capitella teleta]
MADPSVQIAGGKCNNRLVAHFADETVSFCVVWFMYKTIFVLFLHSYRWSAKDFATAHQMEVQSGNFSLDQSQFCSKAMNVVGGFGAQKVWVGVHWDNALEVHWDNLLQISRKEDFDNVDLGDVVSLFPEPKPLEGHPGTSRAAIRLVFQGVDLSTYLM